MMHLNAKLCFATLTFPKEHFTDPEGISTPQSKTSFDSSPRKGRLAHRIASITFPQEHITAAAGCLHLMREVANPLDLTEGEILIMQCGAKHN